MYVRTYTYPREIYTTRPFYKKEVPAVKVLQFEYASILPETKRVYYRMLVGKQWKFENDSLNWTWLIVYKQNMLNTPWR